MRFFNTEGPVRPDDHYCIPPLERIDLDTVLGLVRDKKYFVLHAPRQTGKTSALLALRDLLNGGGDYRCVYADFEVGQAAREDTARAMRPLLGELARQARVTLGDDTPDALRGAALETEGADGALIEVLSRWAGADPRPLVLLIDEIDTLIGDTLVSVLRQLRAGYNQRPAGFPHSVILCGVVDVRDYRIRSSASNALVLGGSAFNVKSKSLRLGDFTEPEVRTLLSQHTAETGQTFTEDALQMVRTRTAGQPWLVNALCYDACFDDGAGRDRSRPITGDDILAAQERLILRRDTHIDQLAHKLREERVRRVIEPILAGAAEQSWSEEDLLYLRDLGLIAQDAGGAPRIANPIYAEVVPRHLNAAVQAGLPHERAWYVDADGALDVEGLIADFQTFFREHSEHWVQRFEQYQEAGPQLLLQAHLQRVVNGGGVIEREYALGRGRTDLLIPLAAGRAHAEVRGRVQAAAGRSGAHDHGGRGADARLHGPLRRGVGPPDRVRPRAGPHVGGEDLPPRPGGGRGPGHRVGHVTAANAVTSPSPGAGSHAGHRAVQANRAARSHSAPFQLTIRPASASRVPAHVGYDGLIATPGDEFHPCASPTPCTTPSSSICWRILRRRS